MNRPTRRDVVASLAGACGVAGVGIAAAELAPTPAERVAPSTASGTGDDPAGDGTGDRTVAAFAVGRRTPVDDGLGDGPHSVVVENGAGATREVSVSVAHRRFGSWRGVTARTFELRAGRRVAYRLRDPGHYRFSVAAEDVADTVDVRRRAFDCNDSTTAVVVGSDAVASTTRSTTVGCLR